MGTSLRWIGASAAGMVGLLSVAAPLATSAQVATTSTSTATVTIAKFVDGQMATASSTGSASFPFSATWQAANLNGGATTTGTFSLSPTGMNTATPYQAVTAAMNTGASYAVQEQTGNATVGTSCTGGQPYRLLGYTTGDTLQAAQNATISSTSPSFTNLTNNKFVIAWNSTCAASTTVPTPQPLSPANGATTTSANLTMVDWTDVTNSVGGITYTYQVSNASTTNSSGAFTSPLFTSGQLASSSIATPNTPVGTYFWHVMARDSNGNTSAWSPTWSFTVTATSTGGNGTTTPPTTGTVKVHILKYLDGSEATASSANSTLFPMTATWMASNLNGGATTSGTYSLGNAHGGAAKLYGADTSAMNVGANYATNEITSTSSQFLPIGAACTSGKYQLVGYTSSPTSFAAAAAMTPTATAPSFSNLQQDQYVIVWNKKCDTGGGNGTTTPPVSGTGSLWVQKFTVGGDGTFSFNANKGLGSFTITTDNGYGSRTLTGLEPGNYNVTEPQNLPGGWRQFINTCHNVKVRANQLAFCFVVNRLPVNQWDTVGLNNSTQWWNNLTADEQ